MTTSEERPGDVLSVVAAAIDDESDSGRFATADVLRVVRRDLDPPPTSEEVIAALNLLALPNINGIRADGDSWRVADPMDVVARRLCYLAEAVADYRHGYGGSLHLDDDAY
ncbi:hypothetical protein [Nocardia sp. XZ_19_369]|uniref:hypothetical protein n=1 Tax=Nocardia sp. XZ_19_369 TaxID=2769487 RepID=UPI00188F91EE|nr:hypothetical protein [Nocardia sp. XZ_19_369]